MHPFFGTIQPVTTRPSRRYWFGREVDVVEVMIGGHIAGTLHDLPNHRVRWQSGHDALPPLASGECDTYGQALDALVSVVSRVVGCEVDKLGAVQREASVDGDRVVA